jgi:hypothetical protein
MNWTAKDEQRHREIAEEMSQLQARREKAVSQLQELLRRCYDPDLEGVSAEMVIQRADSFRDALQPFDNGIRCAKEAS